MRFTVLVVAVKKKKKNSEWRPCLALASEGFPDQHKGDPFSQQGDAGCTTSTGGSIKRLAWRSTDISEDSQSSV